jgi:hypothetical protein
MMGNVLKIVVYVMNLFKIIEFILKMGELDGI